MILWLISLFILTSVVIVGYYQGALRVAISLVGLLAAAVLASPIGALFGKILPMVGFKNPLTIAFLSPVFAFVIVLIIFKCVGAVAFKKAEAWYKYKASDTHRMLWERLNSRVGAPLGLANGIIYVFAICTFLNTLGYLTRQVASDNDWWLTRFANRLSADVQSTGMSKAVAPFMPKSELYYDAADVVADIYHTPLLQNRLANYPPFLLVGEREEFKPLSDPGFQGEWIKGGLTFGGFANHEKIKPLVENPDIVTNVLAMLSGDLKDLKSYLQTGKSPKYDDEKILGRWAFDYKASLNLARRKKPNMGSAEIRKLRQDLTGLSKATLVATVDNKAIVKFGSGSSGTTQGTWKGGDGKYVLRVSEASKRVDLEVTIEGRNLIFSKDGHFMVFENTRV